MREISLTQGRVALVDDSDFEFVNQFNWYAGTDGYNWYARRAVSQRPTKIILMHRFIMKPLKTQQLDHINNNGLDNQRINLRFATHTQNQQNRKADRRATSKYKGVCWHKKDKLWWARIRINKKSIYLGRYKSEKEAARVYDKAATKHCKEFAYTNKMLGLL